MTNASPYLLLEDWDISEEILDEGVEVHSSNTVTHGSASAGILSNNLHHVIRKRTSSNRINRKHWVSISHTRNSYWLKWASSNYYYSRLEFKNMEQTRVILVIKSPNLRKMRLHRPRKRSKVCSKRWFRKTLTHLNVRKRLLRTTSNLQNHQKCGYSLSIALRTCSKKTSNQ